MEQTEKDSFDKQRKSFGREDTLENFCEEQLNLAIEAARAGDALGVQRHTTQARTISTFRPLKIDVGAGIREVYQIYEKTTGKPFDPATLYE